MILHLVSQREEWACSSSRVAIAMKLTYLLATLALVHHVLCEVSAGYGSSKQGIGDGALGCTQHYTAMCFKLDVVSLVERLAETDNYQLLPGVTVVKDNTSLEQQGRTLQSAGDLMASLAKEFPNDADARVDAYLLRRIGQYLDTHSIAVKLFDDDSLERARDVQREYEEQDVDEQTGRGKGKKGMGQLMMMLMMMKGTLLPIAFGTLAMLAGKALMTGLLALMLSAIIGLKSLTSGHGKQAVTYEIVQKPVYSHAHTHSHELHHEHGGSTSGGGYSHSSYGRSFGLEPGTLTFQDAPEEVDSHQLAYNGYKDDIISYS